MYTYSPHLGSLQGIDVRNAADGDNLVYDAASGDWVPMALAIPTGPTIGAARRIPYVNAGSSDFSYESGFEYDEMANAVLADKLRFTALNNTGVANYLGLGGALATASGNAAIWYEVAGNNFFIFQGETTCISDFTLDGADLKLKSGSNTATFDASGLTASQTYTLPPADGSSGDVLTTDGSGGLSFSSLRGLEPVLFGYLGSDSAESASAQTVAFDNFDALGSGFSYTNSGGEITINEAGLYRIEANITVSTTWAGWRYATCVIQLDTGSGFADVAGSSAVEGVRNAAIEFGSMTCKAYLSLSVGDKIRVRETPSATLFIVADSNIEIARVGP